MNSDTTRRLTTVIMLILAVAAIWYVKQIKDEQITIDSPEPAPVTDGNPQSEEVAGEENETVPTVNDPELNPENWNLEDFEAFFVEYRMQRDRVRANEVEMLNGMIENPNITADGKKQAEEQLLALIELMEKELMIENMLKAQGYKDAVFFMKDGRVNVVVQASGLNEEQFLQIAETVSNASGVSIENISVIEHSTEPQKQ